MRHLDTVAVVVAALLTPAVLATNYRWLETSDLDYCNYDCDNEFRPNTIRCQFDPEEDGTYQTHPAGIFDSVCENNVGPKPTPDPALIVYDCSLVFGQLYTFDYGLTEPGGDTFSGDEDLFLETAWRTTIFHPKVFIDTGSTNAATITSTQRGYGDWMYQTGRTTTGEVNFGNTGDPAARPNTGPTYGDHTTGLSYALAATDPQGRLPGGYFHVEGTAGATDEEAIGQYYFDSPVLDSTKFSGACNVSFWLHGNGPRSHLQFIRFAWVNCNDPTQDSQLDIVDVRSSNGAPDANEQHFISTATREAWRNIVIDIPNTKPDPSFSDKLRFRWDARNNANNDGDWCIDDIVFSQGCGPVPAQVNMGVTGSASVSTVVAGSATPIAVTYTVTNDGPDEAEEGATISWSLPPGTTFVSATGTSWSCPASPTTGSPALTCTYATALADAASAPNLVITYTVDADTTSTVTGTATVGTPVVGDIDSVSSNDEVVTATTVTVTADVGVAVTPAAASVTAGSATPFNLQYTVNNAGPSAAAGVQLAWNLPAGTTFSSGTGTGWTCTPASPSPLLTCSLAANLDPSSSAAVLTIAYTADADTTGTLDATATVSTTAAGDTDPDATDDSVTTSTTVATSADVSITGSTTATGTAGDGAIVAVAYTVANAGPSDATGLAVTWDLPSDTTFSSGTGTGWTCTPASPSPTLTCTLDAGTLAGGATASALTISYVLDDTASGTVSTTAAVAADPTDADSSDDSVTTVNTVTTSADVSMTVGVSPTTIAAGSSTPVDFEFDVSNAGPSAASGVQITWDLPSGATLSGSTGTGWSCTPASPAPTLTCTLSGSLASSASAATLTVSYTVDEDTAAGTLSSSSALSSGADGDPDTSNNADTSSVTTTVAADVGISAPTTGSTAAGSGTPFAVAYTVTNAGPSLATGVQVTWDLPSDTTFSSVSGIGWSCSPLSPAPTLTCTLDAGTLSGGASASDLTIAYTADAAASGNIVSTATLTTSSSDPNASDDSVSTTTTVSGDSDLSLAASASVSTIAAGSATPVAITYTVSNAGPSNAAGTTVTWDLPAGTTFVSGAGTGWTCTPASPSPTLTCVLTPDIPAGGTAADLDITFTVDAATPAGDVTTTAAVSSGADGDPDSTGDSVTATVEVQTQADVSVAVTGESGDPVTPGSGTPYAVQFVASNAGPSGATDVQLTWDLPVNTTFVSGAGTGWTCTPASPSPTLTCVLAGSLAASGSSNALTIGYTADSDAAGPSIVSTATVGSSAAGSSEVDGADNAVPTTTAVTKESDLSVVAAAVPSPATAGSTVALTFDVSNAGPSDAAGVEVSWTLPSDMTWVSDAGTGWTCTPTPPTPTTTCSYAGVVSATGSAPQLTLTAQVNSDVSAPVSAPATVSSDNTDPDPSGDTGALSVAVQTAADVGLTVVTSSPTALAGSATPISATFSAFNNGPSDAPGVSFTWDLPAGTTFQGVTAPGWTCTPMTPAPTLTCALDAATLPAGADPANVTVAYTIDASTTGTVTSTGSITSTADSDPDAGSDTLDVVTSVESEVDLVASWTPDAASIVAGSTTPLEVEYSVTNNGPGAATGVQFMWDVPTGTAFQGVSAPGWTCTPVAPAPTLTCSLDAASLGPSATSGAIAVQFTADTAASGTIAAAGTFSTTDPADTDPTPADAVAMASTSVSFSTDLSVAATADSGTAVAGSATPVTVEYVVTNAGPSGSSGMDLTWDLPDNTSFVSATGTGWTCTPAAPSPTLTCSYGSPVAAAASSNALAIAYSMGPGAPGTVTSVGTAVVTQAGGSDPTPGDNGASTSTTVTTSADVYLEAVLPPNGAAVGSSTPYEVGYVARNDGPSDAPGAQVVWNLPSGTTFTSASGPGWTCTPAVPNPTLTCTQANPVPAGSAAPTLNIAFLVSAAAADPLPTSASISAAVDADPGGFSSNLDTAVPLQPSPSPSPSASPSPTPSSTAQSRYSLFTNEEKDLSLDRAGLLVLVLVLGSCCCCCWWWLCLLLLCKKKKDDEEDEDEEAAAGAPKPGKSGGPPLSWCGACMVCMGCKSMNGAKTNGGSALNPAVGAQQVTPRAAAAASTQSLSNVAVAVPPGADQESGYVTKRGETIPAGAVAGAGQSNPLADSPGAGTGADGEPFTGYHPSGWCPYQPATAALGSEAKGAPKAT